MSIFTDLNSFNPTDKSLLEDVETVYQSIFNILNTKKGERLFEPEFGITFEDSLFELMDNVTSFQILHDLTTSLGKWEPRVVVDLHRTTITPIPEESKYDMVIVFQIKGMSGQYTYEGSLSK